MLPFTTEEFFAVFARYNIVIWPAQIGAEALGLVALILLLRSRYASSSPARDPSRSRTGRCLRVE
jgi:hypothetical protein